MNPLTWITSGAIEGVGKAVSGVAKVFVGDKSERDSQAHDEQMSVMQTFAAEFLPRENRTWWDSFVDGLNRLPRPVMTFGTIALFVYCIDDPAGFTSSMTALRLMPAEGWAVLGTIVVFWFGGKFIEKSWGTKIEIPSPEQIAALRELRRDMRDEQTITKADITWNGPRQGG